SGEDDSSSRFFKAARTVPSSRVRSLSPALRAATCSARRLSRRSGIDSTPAARPLGRVLLALLLLARLLVVAMLAEIREDAGLLALLLEALERALEALVIVEDDLGHLLTHPSQAPVRGRQMKNNPEVYGFLSSIGRARVIGRRGGARVLRAGRDPAHSRSTRRPLHLAAAQHVQVKVVDGLATLVAGVDHEAIPALLEFQFPGHLDPQPHHLGDDLVAL